MDEAFTMDEAFKPWGWQDYLQRREPGWGPYACFLFYQTRSVQL